MGLAAASLAATIAVLLSGASYYCLPQLQQSSSAAAAAAAVVIIVIIIIIIIRRRRRMVGWMRLWDGKKGWENRGSGGVFPAGCCGLPVVGETLRLIAAYKTEDPEPFIDERVKRYGSRIFRSHVFGETTVFSADAELNRLVLSGEGKTFEGSYPSSISTLLGTYSLVLMKGSLHKRMHSLTLTRFSSLSILRRSLLPHIDRLIRNTLLHSHSWSTPPVLLLHQAKKITFELTVKQLISCDPGDWTESLRTQYLLLINGFFSLPFPFPSSLFSFTTYGRAIQARKKVAEKLIQVVRKRKHDKTNNNNSASTAASTAACIDSNSAATNTKNPPKEKTDKANDMLDELIEAEEGFTEDQIVDFLLALLVAGYETTPTIMTLAVKFLTETPAALALLKEEHDKIRAQKKHESDPLEWSDYKAMHFTQCVINETLRVANIVSGVFRRATADIYFKGYKIPKGCKVFASFRAVHLDSENFKDARTFNPWRWQRSDENGVFTPFGGGPRLCPGYELARVEISIFLHHLVTQFSWSVAEQDKLVFFPTTRTLKGYPIVVQRRKAYW